MDESVLREKLQGEVGRVSWRSLVPHQQRGHLWLLEDLDLVSVGLAVAMDQLETVSGWTQRGRLRRPTSGEVAAWEDDPTAQHFEFLIVQPFVLVIEHKGTENSA